MLRTESTYVLPVPAAARSQAKLGHATEAENAAVYTATGAPWIYIADRFMCNFDAGTLPGCPSYVDLVHRHHLCAGRHLGGDLGLGGRRALAGASGQKTGCATPSTNIL